MVNERRRRLSVARRGLSLWLLLLMTAGPAPVAAAAATLTLTPDRGSGCIDVVARGEHFIPDSIVTIIADDQPGVDSRTALGEVTVAADGSFTFTLPKDFTPFIRCGASPPAPGGQYIVTAVTGQIKGPDPGTPFANTVFTVTTSAPSAAEAFTRTWSRMDKPVADGQASRTWTWGPAPFAGPVPERYADAPGGSRLVQYFDKSRMEINNPDASADDPWYVTNGLLVVEMIEGKYQIGDTAFDETPAPAAVNIVGDPGDETGMSPTYADINAYGLMDTLARAEGVVITQRLDAAGNVINDAEKASMNVTTAQRVTVRGNDGQVTVDHTITSPFWEFMNSKGVVWDDQSGQYTTADLFPNPFYATGYPIIEAYWTRAMVGGTERDILFQCFERRCLTYTPDNPPGWQVEAGNVGRHYYAWRTTAVTSTRFMNVGPGVVALLP